MDSVGNIGILGAEGALVHGLANGRLCFAMQAAVEPSRRIPKTRTRLREGVASPRMEPCICQHTLSVEVVIGRRNE